MARRITISKISNLNFVKRKTKASCFQFTSAASPFSETTDGKEYSKEHGTPVAEAGKRVSEMAGKFEETIDKAEKGGGVREDEEKDNSKDKLKKTLNKAKETTERVGGKAKEVVEKNVDVMRPAEEHREKVVDPREIDAVRRPLDEKKQ